MIKDNKPHKNLLAWKEAMDFVIEIYSITDKFPKSEQFGLSSQMRRAVVSVPSNIAEGSADRTSQQFTNYLSIAIGSLSELDTQIEICHRLGYIELETFEKIYLKLDHCRALTYGLRKSVNGKR